MVDYLKLKQVTISKLFQLCKYGGQSKYEVYGKCINLYYFERAHKM